jgi:hypothetical protein
MNKSTIVAIVGIVFVFAFMINDAKADTSKVTNWFQNEWNEIVTFQKTNWSKGQEQLAQNKLQVQDLFNKVKEYVTQD